ncbi:MAG: hypothetical protein ABI142_04005 [Bryocella sp.]
MKIAFWIFIVLLAIGIPVAMYFIQRARQRNIDRTGVVLYASVIAMKPMKVFGKVTPDMVKMTLWVQEPDQDAHEVTLKTRVPANQKIEAGMRIPVVVDPKNSKRVFPASEESIKRLVLTGPRRERRVMQSGRGAGSQQRPNSGYQPPQPRGGRRG